MELWREVIDIMIYIVAVSAVVSFFVLLHVNGAQKRVIETQRKLIDEYKKNVLVIDAYVKDLENANYNQKRQIENQDRFLNGAN